MYQTYINIGPIFDSKNWTSFLPRSSINSVFAYSKTERYYISRLCFEIARQFRLSIDSVICRGISKQNLLMYVKAIIDVQAKIMLVVVLYLHKHCKLNLTSPRTDAT
jgi:hypothetical protein